MQTFMFVALNIIVVLLQFELAHLKRISEIKCEEYSKITRSPNAEVQPHLVRIFAKDRIKYLYYMMGTLVSDKFVLTSVDSGVITTTVYEVYFTDGEMYNVGATYTHPYYKPDGYYHNLVLHRLEIKIIVDSIHRPACLWTKNYVESTYAEVIKWIPHESTSHFTIRSFPILHENACKQFYSQSNASCLCLQPKLEDRNFTGTLGSPMQVYRPEEYLPDNFFIYAINSYIINDIYPPISVGTKTSVYLDWIESMVWETRHHNCGRIQINFKPLITFSTPTFHGEFPWHAAIYRKETRGNRNYICGGTLLNENTVLTAAHCVSDQAGVISPRLLIVALGKYDLDIASLDSWEGHVDRVIPHEFYNRNHLENDIAILKLKIFIQYSNFIQPICVSNDPNIFLINIGVVPGWGRNEHNIGESHLTKASLPIKTDTECRNTDRNIYPMLLNGKNFCAGYGNGTSVCSGDSGGGFIVNHGDQWYLRGIVSLGVSLPNQIQCDIIKPVIFTDVTKFYYWIINKM